MSRHLSTCSSFHIIHKFSVGIHRSPNYKQSSSGSIINHAISFTWGSLVQSATSIPVIIRSEIHFQFLIFFQKSDDFDPAPSAATHIRKNSGMRIWIGIPRNSHLDLALTSWHLQCGWREYDIYCRVMSHKTRDSDPMLYQCWASV